jgi:hypothetical protein
VLLAVKAIFAVVSGVLLIQTNIFISSSCSPGGEFEKVQSNQMVVYATKAKIGKALNNQELITNNFL